MTPAKTFQVRIRCRQGPNPGSVYKTTLQAGCYAIAARKALDRLLAHPSMRNALHRQIDVELICLSPKRGCNT